MGPSTPPGGASQAARKPPHTHAQTTTPGAALNARPGLVAAQEGVGDEAHVLAQIVNRHVNVGAARLELEIGEAGQREIEPAHSESS